MFTATISPGIGNLGKGLGGEIAGGFSREVKGS